MRQVSSLLKFATVVLVSVICAALSSQAVVTLAAQQPALRAAKADSAFDLHLAGGAQATGAVIPKAADGHYWANGKVNGASVRFLVDTGATAVALTPTDAASLGLKPEDLRYSYRVVTAGGQTRAAAVKLASITVAGAQLHNVDALVIEKGLDTSLLGMTYLGRLSGFEATRDSLILKP
jgi:aspartyl protease family protein